MLPLGCFSFPSPASARALFSLFLKKPNPQLDVARKSSSLFLFFFLQVEAIRTVRAIAKKKFLIWSPLFFHLLPAGKDECYRLFSYSPLPPQGRQGTPMVGRPPFFFSGARRLIPVFFFIPPPPTPEYQGSSLFLRWLHEAAQRQ